MTWYAWTPDGKHVKAMNGKVLPAMLKERDYYDYDPAEVVRLYTAGLTVKEVIEQTGCPYNSAYHILRRTGTPLRGK